MQQSFETKLGREHHEMIWYGICCVVSLYCFFFLVKLNLIWSVFINLI